MNKASNLVGKYLMCILFLACYRQIRAEDFYVAQSDLGTGNGTRASDARGVSFFNTSSNWSSPSKASGKIGPGDIIHLVGTLTTPLVIQASGTSGKSITILFEQNAKFSVPAIPSSGAIVISGKHYITIDGGSNGIMESTDNGTNLGHKVDSTAIAASDANYLTVKNLIIRNIYVRVAGPEQNGYGSAIQEIGTWTNWTIENCVISHCYIAGNGRYTGACSNITWANNTVTYCNWGFRAGDAGSTSRLDGVVAYGNNVSRFSNWDDTLNNSFHHNGFYCWAEAGGVLRSLSFFKNTIGPDWGVHTTGGIFLSGDFGTVSVYDNLFLESGSNDAPSNGLVTIWPHDGNGSGYKVYNNTFVGGGIGRAIHLIAGNGKNLTTYEIKNNLAVSVGTLIAQFSNTLANIDSDYNVGWNLISGQEFSTSDNSSAGFLTAVAWKLLGLDINGSSSNPNLDSSYRPQSTSTSLLSKGINLSNYFTDDKDGNLRPSSGMWTVGAYQYQNSVDKSIAPSNATIHIAATGE